MDKKQLKDCKEWINKWIKERSKKPFITIVDVNDSLNEGDNLLVYLKPPSIDNRFILISETLSFYNTFALKTALSGIQSK